MASDQEILLRLEQKIDQLQEKVNSLEQQIEGEVMNFISIFTDVTDETIKDLKRDGVDLPSLLVELRPFLVELVKHIQDGSFHTLLSSGILDKKSVETVGALGQALVATKESSDKMGPMKAFFALNDGDVQKTVGFAVRLSKHFGAYLNTNQTPQIEKK
jgi:uncharacterized protein YjgD (DUF1641 family)